MKRFVAVTGNGSTFEFVAEEMEKVGRHYHFLVDGKIVGVQDSYGVVAITDQPYNQKYVK